MNKSQSWCCRQQPLGWGSRRHLGLGLFVGRMRTKALSVGTARRDAEQGPNGAGGTRPRFPVRAAEARETVTHTRVPGVHRRWPDTEGNINTTGRFPFRKLNTGDPDASRDVTSSCDPDASRDTTSSCDSDASRDATSPCTKAIPVGFGTPRQQ